jgi:general secretion pathway protein A
VELLETICEELHLRPRRDARQRQGAGRCLNAYLLDAYAQGPARGADHRRGAEPVGRALEQVRLLTNLETDTQKLLQIILLGQPEAARHARARGHAPARAAHHRALPPEPLDAAETGEYLRHRLPRRRRTALPVLGGGGARIMPIRVACRDWST